MSRRWKQFIMILTLFVVCFWTSRLLQSHGLYHTVFAEVESQVNLEHYRKLLEKGLTVYEIDQELARLSKEEIRIAEQIADTDQDIADQELLVTSNREHAGKVLNAYYIGDRNTLWGLVLSVDNFNDAMTVYEYLSVIFKNDQKTLDHYLTSYKALKQLKADLMVTRDELNKVKQQFLAQRERQTKIQAELDAELAEHPEALTDIIALTEQWEEQGLPLFRSYFKSLALAMNDLPSILNEYPDVLSRKGLNYHFKLSDEQLNAFLRSKDSSFEQLTFEFSDQQIIAKGKQDDISIGLKGHYTLENSEKRNVIRFDVDALSFQEIPLPDVTKQALEKEFDLAFYPQNIAPFVRATQMDMKDGIFTVQLKLTLE